MDLTKLQYEFVKSCIQHPGIDPYYLDNKAMRITGANRTLYKIYAAALGTIPEAGIKQYLIELIAADIPAEDKAIALHLLQYSQTAFTDRQRQQITDILNS